MKHEGNTRMPAQRKKTKPLAQQPQHRECQRKAPKPKAFAQPPPDGKETANPAALPVPQRHRPKPSGEPAKLPIARIASVSPSLLPDGQ
ncbi:hypothetical protein [Paraburkholderia hospita]|uniref:hypothetical protein n=1 Tax=Paraburkholderia hospita TaxID=169430 RepID=UPI0011780674|nr:hypothetical protein [Paraburkholderia hospita]